MTKDSLTAEYALFHYAKTGLGAFAGPSMHDEVFNRLSRLGNVPLTKVELNQLLVLSKAGSMSDGCFRYYWGSVANHPYDVTKVQYYPAQPPMLKRCYRTITCDDIDQVAELLRRIFANEMEYELRHHDSRRGYLKLHERLTDSVVRLQTDDELLTTAFWNNYHNRQPENYRSLAAGKEAERLQE